MPISLKQLRENTDVVRESEGRRQRDGAQVDRVLALDDQYKKIARDLDNLNRAKNKASQLIAQKKKAGGKAAAKDAKSDTPVPEPLRVQEESDSVAALNKATKEELEGILGAGDASVAKVAGQNFKSWDDVCSVGGDKLAKLRAHFNATIPREALDELVSSGVFEHLTIAQLFEVSQLTGKLAKEKEDERTKIEEVREGELLKIGNIVDARCRATNNEDENEVVRTFNAPAKEEKNGEPIHVDVMARLGMITGERVSKIAGGRAYYLKGDLVLLHLALVQYSVNFLVQRGFTPVIPPYFLQKSVMSEVSELADFDDQLYKVSGEGEEKYLIATSEQPICAYHRGQYYSPDDLPLKYVGYSTCFRKECGSHGRDTLGIFRVHQFDKIEQFVVCSPLKEESKTLHEELIANSEEYYKSLGIGYRVVRIVAGALNNAAAMKYDLEGWFPASGAYRELVSCSNCLDYQSRHIDAKYAGDAKNDNEKFVHMLNSTMCALTRTMCLICEQYQSPEGVVVPEALRPFMGGKTIMKYTS